MQWAVFEPNDIHAVPKNVEALVRELIEQVLLTDPGERVVLPDFGGCHSTASFYPELRIQGQSGSGENVPRGAPG